MDYIVIDVNSGGVHIVDDLTYDLLDNVSHHLMKSVLESDESFQSSIKRKILFLAIMKLLNFIIKDCFSQKMIMKNLRNIQYLHL